MAIPINTTLNINTCLVFFKSNNNPKGIEKIAANILPKETAPENKVLENPNSSDMGTTNIDKFKLPAALDTSCTNPTPAKAYHPKYTLDFSLMLFEMDFKII